MAYPPTVPSGARINTTPQVDTHPADHLEIHAALTDIINELGADPSGDSADLTAFLTLLNPVGEIKMYGGASAPSGWEFCRGQSMVRATYADLFAVIGTAFGPGDTPGTTFALPDMQGRSPMGFWPSGTWAATLGANTGAADLVTIEHLHAINLNSGYYDSNHLHAGTTNTDGSHDHNFGHLADIWYNGGVGFGGLTPSVGGMNLATWHVEGDHTHTFTTGAADRDMSHRHAVTGNTDNAGAGVSGTNRNIHPVTVVNYIIRMT